MQEKAQRARSNRVVTYRDSGIKQLGIGVPVLPFTSCGIQGKLINFPVPRFPHP